MFRLLSASLLAVGIPVALVALANSAVAQVSVGPRLPPGLFEVLLVEQAASRLELDDETLAAVRALIEAVTAEENALSEKIRKQRGELRDLLEEPLPDEAELRPIAESLSVLNAEAQWLQLQTSMRVRALLSPDQRVQLIELRKTAKIGQRQRGR